MSFVKSFHLVQVSVAQPVFCRLAQGGVIGYHFDNKSYITVLKTRVPKQIFPSNIIDLSKRIEGKQSRKADLPGNTVLDGLSKIKSTVLKSRTFLDPVKRISENFSKHANPLARLLKWLILRFMGRGSWLRRTAWKEKRYHISAVVVLVMGTHSLKDNRRAEIVRSLDNDPLDEESMATSGRSITFDSGSTDFSDYWLYKARKSVDRQNEVSTAIDAEFNRFGNNVDQQFNDLYNRLHKIKEDYEQRIDFLKNMCQHYTDKLSQRISALAFGETEIRQKLNKLEWDLIFLQCIGRSIIEATSCYLSEINFDNFENTIHKTKKHLRQVNKLLDKNQQASVAYGTALSPISPAALKETMDDASALCDRNDKFTEVLRLVHDSVKTLQRMPCMLEVMIGEEYVGQADLMDEAREMLTMCIRVQRKIGNAELVSTTESKASGGDLASPSGTELLKSPISRHNHKVS